MNAHITANRTAYTRADTPMRTARDAEYEVIARVTQALITAHKNQDGPRKALLEALHRNQTLWSTFATDLAAPGNGLPPGLRAQLLYLWRFTVKHSKLVRDTGASVEVLIDINKAVMRGLRGEVQSS